MKRAYYNGPSRILGKYFGENKLEIVKSYEHGEKMYNGDTNLYGQVICRVRIPSEEKTILVPEKELASIPTEQ